MSDLAYDPFERRKVLQDLSRAALLHVADIRKRKASARAAADEALRELCRVGVPGYDPWADPGECEFDADAARRAVRFFPDMLQHVKGPMARQPFVLEPWQQSVQGNLFGWKRPDGTRRYRECLLYVPKKQGKSAWIAGIVVMVLTTDGEPGAELYSAASSRDQAGIVFDHAVGMVKQNPELREILNVYGARGGSVMKSITYEAEGSSYKCLAADANTADGANVHLAAIDEPHRHRSPELAGVLKKSTAARAQPLVLKFTTADYNRPSACNTEREYAIKVRDGHASNPAYLPVVYEAPVEADHTDRAVWYFANPNLGVSVPEEFIAGQCEEAQAKPSELNDFLRLHLNVITNADIAAFTALDWNSCPEREAEEALRGQVCYGGLDLSKRIDLTAFSLYFPDTKSVLTWSWMPREMAIKAEDRDQVPYLTWAREGHLELTEGDVVDYGFIQDRVLQITANHEVAKIGYDPWNATGSALALQDAGLEMVEVRQGFGSLGEACKELEALVVSHRLRHGINPLLDYTASNLMWRVDANGNLAPDKSKSTGRIDPMVALIMALALSIAQPAEPEAAFDPEVFVIR